MKSLVAVYALCVIFIILVLSGCLVQADRRGDLMTLKGWGAKRGEWTDKDGNKFVIEKQEPLKVPDLIPLRN